MTTAEKRIWTPANVVSVARVGAFPLILALAYAEGYWAGIEGKRALSFFTALIFTLAFLTDILDGYLARSRDEVTILGKMLDPLSDKCLVVTALLVLLMFHRVPAWVAVLIILREIAVTGLRTLASVEGIIVAASMWGKIKTAVQATALGLLLLHYPRVIFGISIDFHWLGTAILYPALAITLWSGYDYFDKVLRRIYGGDGEA